MHKIFSIALSAALSQTPALASETTVQWDNSVGVPAVEGSFENQICLSNSSLNVQNKSLNQTLFTVRNSETVKVIQSFSSSKQIRNDGGKAVTYIQVQFPDRESPNTGWVPEESVRLRGECGGDSTSQVAQDRMSAMATTAQTWTFPTSIRPTVSYKTGMRAFGSSRDGGARIHAAADLYRKNGEAIGAVTTGSVIRDRYYFYLGTYAIEVKHTGGRVVRYGEVTGKAAPGIKLGATLKTGQTVGYVGTVNSGCCSPMLHFEMYTGTATGALTQSGNKYTRRKDLMNPTSDLVVWEKARFGQSY